MLSKKYYHQYKTFNAFFKVQKRDKKTRLIVLVVEITLLMLIQAK